MLYAAFHVALQDSTAQSQETRPVRSSLSHAELADQFELLLEDSRTAKTLLPEDRQSYFEDLTARELPRDTAERLELSEVWKLAAKLVRETEGTTPFLAEALRLASELDPADLDIARAAAFESVRQEKIQMRLDEASRLAESQKGGQR